MRRNFVWIAAAAAIVATAAGPAHATSTQTCEPSQYHLGLQAWTTPKTSADLVVSVTTVEPCPTPESLVEVQVRVGKRQIDLTDVASPQGTATVKLGRVARHQRVDVQVKPEAEVTLTGRTRALLRPDLAVRRLRAPNHALATHPFALTTVVAQQTPDATATATVSVTTADGTVVGTGVAVIRPRHTATLRVSVALPVPGKTRLLLAVSSDKPEAITTNNRRRATIEATELELTANVVTPAFAGFGGQFNHHVYAQLSRNVGVDDTNVLDMERKMRDLHPEFSRIFFNPNAFSDPDKMQSFVRTVLLAQSTGTTINVTWQGGALTVANGNIQKFANVLIDLVQNRGVTRLRWLTLQNEPNRTRITPAQYEAQYRALDPYIQSIRGQVKYMGGDLVRGPDSGGSTQELWFAYMASHMSDILDAYSIHVFWDFWDTQKLQDRLTEVRAIVDALPENERKPLYVAEYGVRGLRTFNGAKTLDPGVWTDGTAITQTNVSAFQHEWFDILASRLGYMGTSKWDAYFGKYDNGDQAYWMIGPPQQSWPLYPMYNLMRMVTTHVQRGWKVVDVGEMEGTTKIATAYIGTKNEQIVVGLDTAGAQLNDASGVPVAYTLGGFARGTKLHLWVWNRDGDGTARDVGRVTVDSAGVASFALPQHAAFLLTT